MPPSQKTRILLFVILCACACVSAQKYAWPRQPASIRRAFPGFVTINEFTAGIGMGQTSGPYSSSFYGFTTAFGYQIDRNFIASGGTGISFYDAGILVPVFLDFRYRFNVIRFTPYLFADGGFLLDVSDLKGGTRIFINPGAGGTLFHGQWPSPWGAACWCRQIPSGILLLISRPGSHINSNMLT